MADKNVTLTTNDGADNLYPATKIGQVQGGGDYFDATKTKPLGTAGQILRVNEHGTGVEWVDPYDASTAVISDTVVPDDPNPVSGDAVYQALGQSHMTNPENLSGITDIVPGLYSINISGAEQYFPTGFSLAQKIYLVSLEVPEANIVTAIDCLLLHEELAINTNDGTINHNFSINVYYAYDDNDRQIRIDLWMDNVEVVTRLINGVTITRLLKYI